MTHADLVQAATDLIYSAPRSDYWVSEYDLALSAETDLSLNAFITRMQHALQNQQHQIAA